MGRVIGVLRWRVHRRLGRVMGRIIGVLRWRVHRRLGRIVRMHWRWRW
jgi:hypothetical protein